MGMPLSYAFDAFGKEAEPPTTTTGIQFTETMRGYFSVHEREDYDRAYATGKEENSPFEFTLTIHSEDVDSLININIHEAGMIGTMKAPALSAAPMTALQILVCEKG